MRYNSLLTVDDVNPPSRYPEKSQREDLPQEYTCCGGLNQFVDKSQCGN